MYAARMEFLLFLANDLTDTCKEAGHPWNGIRAKWLEMMWR